MSNIANDPANMSEETFRHYEQMAYSQIEDRVKQLEAENAKLLRQVEFLQELAEYAVSDIDPLDLYYAQDSYSKWLEFDSVVVCAKWKIKDPRAEESE